MKKIYLAALLLALTTVCFGQREKWRQKDAKVNFMIKPQAEFYKIADTYAPVVSVNIAMVLNNAYYVGVYGAKKVLRAYDELDALPGAEFDANFQHVGVELQYSKHLGLYRTKGGHYVMRKSRLLFSLRLGGGSIWLDDDTKTKATSQDYFYYAQPMIGFSFPLNGYLRLNTGAQFCASYSIDKLNPVVEDKDFLSPGIYLGVEVYLFRNSK